MDITIEFLSAIINAFEANKRLADRAIEQVPDDKLHVAIDGNTNSIAVIMKHVAGNLTSRWTDFLTTDGEKPDRDRDGEFTPHGPSSRAGLLTMWNDGFAVAFAAIDALTPGDLEKIITIRQQPMSVIAALERSVTHLAYHVGQIVYLSRHFAFASGKWTTLSMPKVKK